MTDVEALIELTRTLSRQRAERSLDSMQRTILDDLADALESLNRENQALATALEARIES